MIPITRKENYLNEIVGWGETAPEKPLTPEEFFFAAILGEAVQTPEPLSRYQIYLAKIAGRNISVPKPLTRLELFLAKACGMDIEIPTPITREEIFWSNYSAIVDFEVEGVPPLTYKTIEGTLENYRIYGNTVGGESVGDRTGNLFDETNGVVTDIFIRDDGTTAAGDNGDKFICNRINVLPNTTYTFSWQQMILGTANNTPFIRVSSYDANNNFLVRNLIQANVYPNKTYGITTLNNAAYWDIRVDDVSSQRRQHLEGLMLNEGSIALPYEPYGYKVPVTVEGKNLFEITKFANGPVSLTVSGITFTISNNKVIYSGTSTAIYPQVLSPRLPLIPGQSYHAKIIVKGTYEGLVYIYFNGRETPESERANYKRIEYSTEEVFTAWYDTSVLYVAHGNNKHFDASVEVVITKVPSVTTPVYLPEPIKMVGDEAEYIDYAEQKQYRIGADDIDVTLPALPTLTGTNVLSVGTAVQPSKIEVKGKIKSL